MKHPIELLSPEYKKLLGMMRVTRFNDIDATARRLVKNYDSGHYRTVSEKTGIPIVWMAASFEREASSNFSRSPAQGDRWDQVSKNVPRGRGPFPGGWDEAALDAYSLNGLDKVGASNWTWALMCYYGELFNGFGYRDFRGIRSPYLWGGTSLQQRGKYTSDGKYDSTVMDSQLGIVPIMMRMCELRPGLTIADPWPFVTDQVVTVPLIAPTKTQTAAYDIFAVQQALLDRGFSPGNIDGSFGRKTSAALRAFEAANGLTADGLLDQQTVAALGL